MQISLLNLVPEMQLANIYQRKRDMIRDRAVGRSENPEDIGLLKEKFCFLNSYRDPGGTIPSDNYLPIKLAKYNKFVTGCHENIKISCSRRQIGGFLPLKYVTIEQKFNKNSI